MSDRYRDSRNSYNDEQYDRYEDGRYADSSRRSARSADNQYAGAAQRSNNSYSRQSDAYRSASSASSGAGAYANDYRAANQGQRYSQGSNAGYGQGQNPNLFSDYYPEETAETYSRSAYGSGTSRSSASRSAAPYRSHSSYQQPPAQGRTVTPAQPGRGGYGSSAHAKSGAAGGYAPKRSNRKRNIIIAAVVVVAVVLIGAGAAWAYVNSINENLHKGVTEETLEALEPAEGTATETALADAPFYMLLMGADIGSWRTDDPSYAGDEYGRSDSMILARIDPVNKKCALISIHRDTMVDLGEYGQQKINAAYEFYGPAGAIKAVSTMAGVPISHYAVVDFGGFSEIVDALGGVEVNVPMDIDDDVIETHIDAGWQTLDGETALDLCRSRHSYDDVADDGDVMRAANQRMVIGALAKKILASDIMTIATTVQTLSKYVSTDLNVSDIVGLAQIFKGLDPDKDMYTAMEPTTSAYIDDVWYEYLDEPAWREMINRMDQGLPPVNKTEIDDRTGTVLSTGGADAPVV